MEQGKGKETRELLVLEMKRCIELLGMEDTQKDCHSREFAELQRKLHEVRRDSIRYIQERKPWVGKLYR